MTIAKYLRLSIEDAKSDSLSIENQRLMLDHFIAEYFPDTDVMEFVDNGYSGTNFNRPSIKELLSLAQKGEIDCIAVKDFSRFGRSSIETGFYIEKLFPLIGVRFISLGDDYDSEENTEGICGVGTVFKFLTNELYSRDLSEKIRSARAATMRRGECAKNDCPYGYTLAAGKTLELNASAADVVRMIFEFASAGKSTGQIRAALQESKIPTPLESKKNVATPVYNWDTSTILKILRDERYTGTYVAGKTGVLDIGSGRTISKDESEWVKIPGHHPAIIDSAAFDVIQKKFAVKKNPSTKRQGLKIEFPSRECLPSVKCSDSRNTDQTETNRTRQLYEQFMLGEISAEAFRVQMA